MRSGALLIGFIITFSSSIQSQSIIPKREQKADKYFGQQSYAKAERLYLKLISNEQANKRVELKLARTYYMENRFDLAYRYYSDVIYTKYLVNSSDYLNYAQTLISNEKFDSAAWWTNKYLIINPISQKAQNILHWLTSGKYYDKDLRASSYQGPAQPMETALVTEGTLLKLNSGNFVKSYVITSNGVIEVMRSNQPQDIEWLDQLLKENNIIITDRVNVNPVLYRLGQTNLDDRHKAELDKLADLMGKFKMIEFEISGHADSSGPEDFNRQLSQLRASAARDYLMTRDIQTKRLLAIGYGENKPVTSGNDHLINDVDKNQNRRLEFRLVYLNKDRMISTY